MDNLENKLISPLTFRLYQSVRFNRPVDREKDFISPGSYELKVKVINGIEKIVQFDFEDYEGSIDKDDPCVVHCMQKNPDYVAFKDLEKITEHMLRNITEVIDWFIYTGEPGEDDVDGNPLVPVEVFDAYFEIIGDATGKDMPHIRIPITIPIVPSSNFPNENDSKTEVED